VTNRLIITHAQCQDGFGAAWAAYQAFGFDAEYMPAKHGDLPPDVRGRDVIVADFAYPRAELLRMKEQANSLRVLDHHKTAEADLAGLDFCIFDMNRSGAGLMWDEVTAEYRGERRTLIDYVEDRDLWRFALPQSKAINGFIGSYGLNFGHWDHVAHLLETDFDGCVSIGDAILRGVNKYVYAMAEHAREREIAGYRVLCVNAPYLNCSELVGHLAERNFGSFAAGWFQRSDGKYQYSLRSRGAFDVSEVAKQFGGGGHKNAAGFSVAERVDR
jgi:hypothetical protein